MNSTWNSAVTFLASAGVGCVAAIAIASAGTIGETMPGPAANPATTALARLDPAPAMHAAPTTTRAATPVVRLDPVVVTVSKARFDEIRTEEQMLARANAARKVAHG